MAIDIHATALVDAKAVLHDNVSVGPFCMVGPHVELGEGTRLQNHVTIIGHTRLGMDNIVFPYCVIGAEPQDLSYRGTATRVEIGDRNIFREGVTIHRGTEKEAGVTTVGSDNFIMAYCHFAHDCIVGSHIHMANNTLLGGHVNLEDYASLSGLIAVHQFVTIGSYSFIGGMSRITTDVPPFMLVEGNPSEVRCVNLVGLRRRGFSNDDIRGLTEAHRLLYRHHQRAEQARQILHEQGLWGGAVAKLFEFVDVQHQGRHGRGRERLRAA